MNRLRWFLTYEGRLGRLSFYLYYIATQIIIAIFLAFFYYFYNNVIRYYSSGNTIIFLFFLFVSFFLYATSCLVAKRFHDINKSGWNVLWWYPIEIFSIIESMNGSPLIDEGGFISFVALLGIWPIAMMLAVILFFRKGTVGINKYGPENNREKPSSVSINKKNISVEVFCRKCGVRLEDDSTFCSSCGMKVQI